MKLNSIHLLALALGLSVALPNPHIQSQLAPSVDPTTEMQALQTVNDDLIKRQEATLKDLTDMTATANEVRIFSKRN